jgi:hypothetical protein
VIRQRDVLIEVQHSAYSTTFHHARHQLVLDIVGPFDFVGAIGSPHHSSARATQLNMALQRI